MKAHSSRMSGIRMSVKDFEEGVLIPAPASYLFLSDLHIPTYSSLLPVHADLLGIRGRSDKETWSY